MKLIRPVGTGQLRNRRAHGVSTKDKSPGGALATSRTGLEPEGCESRRETTLSLSGYRVVVCPIPVDVSSLPDGYGRIPGQYGPDPAP